MVIKKKCFKFLFKNGYKNHCRLKQNCNNTHFLYLGPSLRVLRTKNNATMACECMRYIVFYAVNPATLRCTTVSISSSRNVVHAFHFWCRNTGWRVMVIAIRSTENFIYGNFTHCCHFQDCNQPYTTIAVAGMPNKFLIILPTTATSMNLKTSQGHRGLNKLIINEFRFIHMYTRTDRVRTDFWMQNSSLFPDFFQNKFFFQTQG